MQLKKILAVGLIALGAAGVAFASGDREGGEGKAHRMHGEMRHASVEFAAMHNIMADLLSAKTGKSVAEIRALFDKSGPHEAFEQLGLSKDEIRPLFKEARQTLITRAAAAGLITAQQAEHLRAAKVEMRHERHQDNDE